MIDDSRQESGWPVELPRSGRDAISFALRPVAGSLFREYDLRGKVNLPEPDPQFPLNEFVGNRIGRAFGTFLSRRGVLQAVVGYDSRSYSESIANSVILGLLSAGVEVTLLGLATTPMVYFAQHAYGVPAGVSITASHNPNGWAGLKLSHSPSVTLGPEEIHELHEIVDSRKFASGSGCYSERNVTAEYIDYIAELAHSDRALRVVVDGANGIAGPIAEMALQRAGHEVIAINRELDWNFPNHEPDPETVEARRQIQQAVLEHGADLGISLDGDGDRLGITDDRGQIVWSDTVLALLARDVLSRHPGAPIIFDVKCSRTVPDVINAAGGQPVMWMTGHSHIKAKLHSLGAPFAGERSGHFFDASDYFGYDDAVYSALCFLKILVKAGEKVSKIVAALPTYVGTPTMQAACADDVKYEVVDKFADYALGLGAKEIIRINGVRAEFDDGWILVRASSNLPALVIMAEANDSTRLRNLYGLLREGLDRHPEVGKTWSNDIAELEGAR